MELKYLKDFLMLAEIRHFQETANVLFISQSSLSKHIKAIEAELGHELFIRSRKCTELTEFGKQFLPYAQKLVEIQQQYTIELLTEHDDHDRVAIGIVPMVTMYNFMGFYDKYAKKNACCQFQVIQGGSQDVISLLQQRKVDFILTYAPPVADEKFQKVFYTSDHLVALLPANHRLSSAENVSIEELEKEKLITFTNSTNIEHYLQHQYPGHDFHASIAVEKEAFLFELIQKGYGISLMTQKSAMHYNTSGDILSKEIVPPSSLNIYMVYLKNHKLPPLARAFAQYLKKRNTVNGITE